MDRNRQTTCPRSATQISGWESSRAQPNRSRYTSHRELSSAPWAKYREWFLEGCSEGLVATPAAPEPAPDLPIAAEDHSVFTVRTAPRALSAGPRGRCRVSRSALGWALRSAGRSSATTHRGRGLVTFALQRVPADFNLLI